MSRELQSLQRSDKQRFSFLLTFCCFNPSIMKQHKLSTSKRLTKPILFGTIIVGLAAAFINRHRFFEDIDDLRAEERARNEAKRTEILERRQRQIEEVAELKRRGGNS